MDDDAAQVNQDPFTGVFTFNADDAATYFADLIPYRSGKCLGLAVGAAAGDYDAFEEAGQPGCVKHHDICGFHILEGMNSQ